VRAWYIDVMISPVVSGWTLSNVASPGEVGSRVRVRALSVFTRLSSSRDIVGAKVRIAVMHVYMFTGWQPRRSGDGRRRAWDGGLVEGFVG